MPNNYFFSQDITINSINDLVERLESGEGKFNLYFATDGGSPEAMSFLIQYMNTRKDEIEVTLTNAVMSAGTKILTDFKGKINISDGLDVVMFHMWDRESYSLRKGFANDRLLTAQDFEENKKFAKKLKKKKFLTDKQIKQFLKGKDVFVYKKQIKTWKNLHK